MLELQKTIGNRFRCTVCHSSIKDGTEHIDLPYIAGMKTSHKRVCDVCIWLLSQKVNVNRIKKDLKTGIIKRL